MSARDEPDEDEAPEPEPEPDPAPEAEAEAAEPAPRRKKKKRRKAASSATAPSETLADAAARERPREQTPRRVLIVGPAILLAGVAITGIEASDAGAVIALVGLLVTIYGVHAFGRLGPWGEPLDAGPRPD